MTESFLEKWGALMSHFFIYYNLTSLKKADLSLVDNLYDSTFSLID